MKMDCGKSAHLDRRGLEKALLLLRLDAAAAFIHHDSAEAGRAKQSICSPESTAEPPANQRTSDADDAVWFPLESRQPDKRKDRHRCFQSFCRRRRRLAAIIVVGAAFDHELMPRLPLGDEFRDSGSSNNDDGGAAE